MAPAANELQPFPPNFALWHAYDRDSRTELHSTAVLTHEDIVVVDPILLNRNASDEFERLGPVKSILLTNVNHQRASDSFRTKYGSPVFGPSELADVDDNMQMVPQGSIGNLEIIPIDGAAPGEVAIYDRRDGGALIMGDALINFDPYGFCLLPPRYCSDQKVMIRSLKRLLDLNFERLLFAHGWPIASGARDRLEPLLQSL